MHVFLSPPNTVICESSPGEPSRGLENPPRVGVGYRPEWRRRLELRRRWRRVRIGGRRRPGGSVPGDRHLFLGLKVVAPDVEVDDKVHVDLLDADGEGVGGVEGDGDEGAARGVLLRVEEARVAGVARVEPELEEAALPAVELDGVVAADLGPLHDRDPLFLVGEQGEIEVRRAGVGLRVDGQLGEHALPRLGDAPVPR